MPIFIAALGGMLLNLVGSIVGRVMVALGIAVVTYTGFSASLDVIKNQSLNAFSSLPPEIMPILGVLKVGVCVSIIFSAVTARLVINGLNGASFKRWINK